MRHYKVKTIQALERGIQVMAALREMRAASLHDLYLNTGIPKPTLTRILYTLYRQGLVWQRMADGAFLPSHIMLQRGRLDDIAWLVEIASPVLEELCERVMWPSVLSVPRLDHMEVVETNSPRAHYDELPAGPIGFRANVLRSASGRAYLAFCPDAERGAVLRRLAERDVAGHELARDPVAMRRILEATRRRGFSVRAPDFGGHYSRTRREADDGRNSIAMPIRTGGHVLGCVNLTWRRRALTLTEVVQRYASDLRAAVTMIENRLADAGVGPAIGAGEGPAGEPPVAGAPLPGRPLGPAMDVKPAPSHRVRYPSVSTSAAASATAPASCGQIRDEHQMPILPTSTAMAAAPRSPDPPVSPCS